MKPFAPILYVSFKARINRLLHNIKNVASTKVRDCYLAELKNITFELSLYDDNPDVKSLLDYICNELNQMGIQCSLI